MKRTYEVDDHADSRSFVATVLERNTVPRSFEWSEEVAAHYLRPDVLFSCTLRWKQTTY